MSCCSRKKTDGKELELMERPSDELSVDPLEIEYLITIKTGNNRNSNTDGPIYIKIFGRDEKHTDYILLPSPFRQDSIKKIQVKAIDIGKPQRIIIRHESKTTGWFVDYVEISVHNFLIRFMANRWLNESKNDRKLSVELFGSEQPAVDYSIEVRTGSEQIEPLDSPVYIQIYGTITTTPKLFLESKSTSFTKNTTAEFNISSNNVGEIQKIVIGHENLGKINDWYLENVKLETSGQQHEFTVNQWLSPTRDKKQLFVELIPQASSPTLETYFITGKTIDIHRTDAIDNLQLSVVGSSGQINRIRLKNSTKQEMICQKGSSDQFEIKEKNIGDVIESITIGFDDNEQSAALLFEFIDIKYKDIVYHFRVNCWLLTRLGPSFSWITIRPDRNTHSQDINYQIIIETGESGIDSNIILCIYGDEKTTKALALRTTKDGLPARFDRDSRLEFNLREIDVGKIQKINIGHDGKGNEQNWFLRSIEIEKQDDYYLFKADRCLNEQTGTFIDLFPEDPKPEKEQTIYTITITTSSENDSGTDSGVFMTIYGDQDQTEQFQLIATNQNSAELLFKPGETNQFEVQLDDVGNITKINIGQDGKGLHPIWHLETVRIQKGSQIFLFHADQVLDYSTPDINLTPIKKTSSSPSSTPRNTKKRKLPKITYKVLAEFQSQQKTKVDNDANLYLIIVGINGQTEKIPLSSDKKGAIEFTKNDVGKISKIFLGQEENSHGIIWQVNNLIIKQGAETTTFNVERSIEQDTEIEVTPSSICQPSKMVASVVKTKDVLYEIKTTTGEKTFEGDILLKIRGEFGTVIIPLSKTESGEKPFQSKAIDVFTSRTNNVGKIKRITLETAETRLNQSWNLKRIQILKGNETYHFNTNNVRLDSHEQKVNLSPITKGREDYVHSELRKLRENLRSESTKLRRPPHKAHEPFVYNDLSPYFDTTTVEKAIDQPSGTLPGYYTRLTALRVVEPWEAFGMDYGVSYDLLKHRSSRGRSVKRSLPTQTGLIMLPPLSLPYGGQITYVNPDHSHSSSVAIKRRFSSKRHHGRVPVTTTTT